MNRIEPVVLPATHLFKFANVAGRSQPDTFALAVVNTWGVQAILCRTDRYEMLTFGLRRAEKRLGETTRRYFAVGRFGVRMVPRVLVARFGKLEWHELPPDPIAKRAHVLGTQLWRSRGRVQIEIVEQNLLLTPQLTSG